MNWGTLIPVIISQGLPVAEKIWQLWSTGAQPTQADWDALKAIGLNTRRQDMVAALIRNGVDPASDKGMALLALVQ